jgi:hypothetical protein
LTSQLQTVAKTVASAINLVPHPKGGRVKKPAVRKIVNLSLLHFDHYRPGKLSATDGSDCRAFVAAIFQLSTGEEADLERPIRAEIKKFRSKAR